MRELQSPHILCFSRDSFPRYSFPVEAPRRQFYDANGDLLNSGTGTNVYDFDNRLIRDGSVSVVYDGDGNRVSETVAGVTAKYLVETINPTGYAQVVDELVNGSITPTYAYGLQRISENQLNSGTWTPSFYGYDGHGSIRFLTNSASTVTDTYNYDAFGNLINHTSSTRTIICSVVSNSIRRREFTRCGRGGTDKSPGDSSAGIRLKERNAVG